MNFIKQNELYKIDYIKQLIEEFIRNEIAKIKK